jgi:predicted membrane chloride channel (bestrophin family)
LLICCRWWEARKDVGQLVSLVHDLVRQVWDAGRLSEGPVRIEGFQTGIW